MSPQAMMAAMRGRMMAQQMRSAPGLANGQLPPQMPNMGLMGAGGEPLADYDTVTMGHGDSGQGNSPLPQGPDDVRLVGSTQLHGHQSPGGLGGRQKMKMR